MDPSKGIEQLTESAAVALAEEVQCDKATDDVVSGLVAFRGQLLQPEANCVPVLVPAPLLGSLEMEPHPR